jgi:hypothetical protein
MNDAGTHEPISDVSKDVNRAAEGEAVHESDKTEWDFLDPRYAH